MPTFDVAFRLAIWEVWKHTCAWCGNPLDFEDLDVEHLIPRGLKGDDRKEQLALHGLDEDYDLDSTENLAPAHRRPCNSSKSMKPLPDSPRIDLLRADAKDRAPKIERHADRLRKATSLTRAAAIIEAADPAHITPSHVDRLTKVVAVIQANLGLGEDVRVHGLVDPHDVVRPDVAEVGASFGTGRMKELLYEWESNNDDLFDEVVADGFDASGQELQHASLREVLRIGYVEDLEMFLVRITAGVSYTHYDDEMIGGPADTEIAIDLWVSLDDSRTDVLEISEDHLAFLPELR